MKVIAYKTHKIKSQENISAILDKYLPKLSERQIVVVTSKIVSFCQGRIAQKADKQALVEREADLFIDKNLSRYDITLSVKNGVMIANSGIDMSNGNGKLILWPEEPFEAAVNVWQHLRKKHNTKKIGVIIADTHQVPMRWGTRGIAIAWCGFEPLKNYIGEPDIFGHKLRMTKASVIDGLAAAADIVMGQGNEQTPLAVISDVPFVKFTDSPPTLKEIESLQIALEDDLYAPVLTSVKWQKGGSS